MFLLDQGMTSTKVYRNGDGLSLVHRLHTGAQEHAVVVERFAARGHSL
jgi:hypothetical protein